MGGLEHPGTVLSTISVRCGGEPFYTMKRVRGGRCGSC